MMLFAYLISAGRSSGAHMVARWAGITAGGTSDWLVAILRMEIYEPV